MKVTYAKIDSLNFRGTSLEELFNKNTFAIEVVKDRGTFCPEQWLHTFGKKTRRDMIEAKIIHTHLGLALPMKRFAVNPSKQTLEFAGLHSYTEQSKLRCKLLKELYPYIQNEIVTRIDIAIDFKDDVPWKCLKMLEKKRTSFIYKNTCYMKTAKEKRSNSHINICLYPKGLKENLDENITRLEFSFRCGYLRSNYYIKTLAELFLKIQKSIMRMSGLKVVIRPL